GTLETAKAPPDPRVLTQQILQRDRRNVEGYAALMLAFWLLAVAATAYFGYDLYMRYVEVEVLVEHFGLKRQAIGELGVTFVIACAALVFLLGAVLFLVLLVFASRRATLRQMNANLIEISQQLKQLQQSITSQASPSAGNGKSAVS